MALVRGLRTCVRAPSNARARRAACAACRWHGGCAPPPAGIGDYSLPENVIMEIINQSCLLQNDEQFVRYLVWVSGSLLLWSRHCMRHYVIGKYASSTGLTTLKLTVWRRIRQYRS